MKMWHKGILLVLLFVTGCASEVEKPTLEDMGMIGVIGFDYLDGDRMKVTVTMPMPIQGSTERTQVFKTISSLPSESLIPLSTKSDRTMVFSQLRVILINEQLARKVGIRKIVRDFARNPTVGDNVFLAIVQGSTEELLTSKYKTMPEINTYLNNLLRPRRETAFTPFSTLHDYLYTSTSQVADPTLPYLVKREEEIQVSQVAVFRGDKMIGLLNEREGKIVQAILGRNMLPKIRFDFKENGKYPATVVFDFVRASSRVRSSGSLKHPVIHVQVNAKGTILGYTGNRNLDDPKQLQEIRKNIESSAKKEYLELLRKLQKMGIDPAMLEESLRTRYRGKWKREIGLAAFKQATVRMDVNIDFSGYGNLK